eukprot:TRINITY_DN15147_c0_g1_i1.p1 TRINITY_DN15147_c0_g1~~TRINITY_DN15147_c0_g1_i1.p1  ORF type:complete len:320 (-),score=45.76 TRINITY_DN15147_c0_g1_i1:38-865(-)
MDAYASVLTAFRAQGELTWRKEAILQDLRDVLRIAQERHRTELQRIAAENSVSYLPPESYQTTSGAHSGLPASLPSRDSDTASDSEAAIPTPKRVPTSNGKSKKPAPKQRPAAKAAPRKRAYSPNSPDYGANAAGGRTARPKRQRAASAVAQLAAKEREYDESDDSSMEEPEEEEDTYATQRPVRSAKDENALKRLRSNLEATRNKIRSDLAELDDDASDSAADDSVLPTGEEQLPVVDDEWYQTVQAAVAEEPVGDAQDSTDVAPMVTVDNGAM